MQSFTRRSRHFIHGCLVLASDAQCKKKKGPCSCRQPFTRERQQQKNYCDGIIHAYLQLAVMHRDGRCWLLLADPGWEKPRFILAVTKSFITEMCGIVSSFLLLGPFPFSPASFFPSPEAIRDIKNGKPSPPLSLEPPHGRKLQVGILHHSCQKSQGL